MLVVLYHFWPNRLHGRLRRRRRLLRHLRLPDHLAPAPGGRAAPAGSRSSRFYARRARRLLPAALLVLLVTASASFAVPPGDPLGGECGDILASTFYVQNWLLAARAVDYSASAAAASAVQHFWSLSVEEQFYLGWPPLILLLARSSSRRLRVAAATALLLGGILVVTVALAGLVGRTPRRPIRPAPTSSTPTRIWELGAGALLALSRARRPDVPATARVARVRLALRWVGLAAIAVAAVSLPAASPFPGYLALLPVLGTVAVIAAGDTGARDPLSAAVASRRSSSSATSPTPLYLWHWPFLVMAPFALGHALPAVQKVGLLAACIALAWLTKVWVEDPTQRWRLLGRPAVTAAFTVAAMLVVSSVSALQRHEVAMQADAARARLAAAQGGPCFGAAARGPAPRCADPFGAACVARPSRRRTGRGSTTARARSPTCRCASRPAGSASKPPDAHGGAGRRLARRALAGRAAPHRPGAQLEDRRDPQGGLPGHAAPGGAASTARASDRRAAMPGGSRCRGCSPTTSPTTSSRRPGPPP